MPSTRQKIASGITTLADWAHGAAATNIPRPVLSRAARVLSDDLAAIVAARNEPEVIQLQNRLVARGHSSEATVFRGGRPRTDRFCAAVANAAAANWLELDEGYRYAPCHAGLYTVPALLAEGEAANISVDTLLKALVISYEVVTRIARSWVPPDLAMHAHGRYAAIGSAMAVGLARRLSKEELLSAFTSAVTLINPGPRDHAVQGALVRNVWSAAGAWNGMMSVEWAQCGLGGLPESFDDVFSVILNSKPQPEQLANGLGERWAVLDGYTKTYACCQNTHSAVQAAIGLRAELLEGGLLDSIAAIEIQTHPYAMPLNNYHPGTTLAARFSLPHAVAAGLRYGEGGINAFSSQSLADQAVQELRSKVEMTEFSPLPLPPNDRPARLIIRLNGGASLTAECMSATGSPDNPLDDAAVLSKACALTETTYPKLAVILHRLVALDQAYMTRGWADVVSEFCD